MDYCPKMDISDPLNPECLSFYQHPIGVMRWMVELSGVDIATEISLLSSPPTLPTLMWNTLRLPCTSWAT